MPSTPKKSAAAKTARAPATTAATPAAAAAPAPKTAAAPAAKTPVAPAPKAVATPAAKAAVVPAQKKPAAKPAARKPAAKAPAAAKAKAEPKAAKPKKPKLVRDSFTIPKPEYAVLETLKERSAKLARPMKKSEMLRAGIKALAAMPDAAFLAALEAVPAIKTGRPKAAD